MKFVQLLLATIRLVISLRGVGKRPDGLAAWRSVS